MTNRVGPQQDLYRLCAVTQVYENYGYRWKPKFGTEYCIGLLTLREVVSLGREGLQKIVDLKRPKFEQDNDSFREYMVDWFLVEPNALTDYERMVTESGYLADLVHAHPIQL